MGILKQLFSGTEQRAVHRINEPIPGSAPRQHVNSRGTNAARNLPIVRKCLGFMADTINEAEPRIIGRDGSVMVSSDDLPAWIRQPSADFVLPEFVAQAVWSLMIDGDLRVLAATGPSGRPTQMYVGSSAMATTVSANGQLIFTDSIYGSPAQEGVIVADRFVHRRRFALPGTVLGLSEFGSAKVLIDSALHAQDALQRFFSSNMFLDLVFTSDDEYVQGAGGDLVAQLARRHAGGENAYRPIVTDRRWKVDRLRDSNQANQLVELVAMVNGMISAQVFGIDPAVFALGKVGDKGTGLTYENVSQIRSKVWLQSVEPVAQQIASAISDFLPRGQRLEFCAEDMLRGSPTDRGQLVATMAQADAAKGGGLFTADEMRDVVGLPSMPEEADVPLAPVSDMVAA